jgi:hypothetical protein
MNTLYYIVQWIILHPWINGDQIIAEAVYQPPIACVTYWSFVANFSFFLAVTSAYISQLVQERLYIDMSLYIVETSALFQLVEENFC